MLFSEYVSLWKQKARIKISDSWRMGQDQILRDHILPILGSLHIEKISSIHISEVMQASINKGHSGNQQKKIYMVMSKVFNDANHFFEIITRSPVKKHFHLPTPKPIERPYMTYEQALIFLEYTMNHPIYAIACWLMVLSGIRISEIESLDWECVDFEKDVIYVDKSRCAWTDEERNYTKNKGQYQVPMCPMLKMFLLERRKSSGKACQNPETGRFNRRNLNKYLHNVSEKIHTPSWSAHILRHSCARIYVEFGATDEQLKELLGHKTIVSTKTYTHRKGISQVSIISKKIA